jgi:hypothetical protein
VRKMWRSIQAASIEVFIALLCLIAGLPILLNPVVYAPATLLAILPLFMVVGWGIALVLGGLLTLIGVLSSNVYIERAGLIMIAAGATILGTAILLTTGFTRLFSVGTYYIFGWAMGQRYLELGRFLKARRLRWRTRVEEKRE